MKRTTRNMMTLVASAMLLMSVQTVTADQPATQPLDQQTYQAAIQSFGVDSGTAEKAAAQSVAAVAARGQKVEQPQGLREEQFARVVENLRK
ncbi:MAG: hypothetical protein ACFCUG_14525 [Thiotrichales bacterium]